MGLSVMFAAISWKWDDCKCLRKERLKEYFFPQLLHSYTTKIIGQIQIHVAEEYEWTAQNVFQGHFFME